METKGQLQAKSKSTCFNKFTDHGVCPSEYISLVHPIKSIPISLINFLQIVSPSTGKTTYLDEFEELSEDECGVYDISQFHDEDNESIITNKNSSS